jgi:hypothetical protein
LLRLSASAPPRENKNGLIGSTIIESNAKNLYLNIINQTFYPLPDLERVSFSAAEFFSGLSSSFKVKRQGMFSP